MEEQEKKDILNDYVNNKLTVDELAFKYHVHTNVIFILKRKRFKQKISKINS